AIKRDWRAERRQDFKLTPQFMSFVRTVESNDRTHRCADRIFNAVVRKHFTVRRNERRHIHTCSRERKAPNLLARTSMQRPNAAIARREDQLLETADWNARRRAERGVVRAGIGSVNPAKLAGRFVEAHKAVSRNSKPAPLRLIAPADHH